jgi:hypothetical protein
MKIRSNFKRRCRVDHDAPVAFGHGVPVALALAGVLLGFPMGVLGQELGWAVGAGGTNVDNGEALATDMAGNSYVTGSFRETAIFDAGGPSETELTSDGNMDIFIAKYDNTGFLMWARRAGGTSADVGMGIAADSAGNSYVTGVFSGIATFGRGEANETELTAAGFFDMFVAKYDTNGSLLWAKPAGSSDSDEVKGIAVDGAGNSYLTGDAGPATFGTGEPTETRLIGSGNFVAKYASTGELVWAKREGGVGADIAVDIAGNSYVIGSLAGSVPRTFGAGQPNETVLTSEGSGSNIMVARFSSDGVLSWARRAGGHGLLDARGIAVDGSGNAYVAGGLYASGPATFGPGETNETELTSCGNWDVFLAKYDSAGALAWALRAGDSGQDWGWDIAVDATGNISATGWFNGTAVFGLGEANETSVVSDGRDDMFLARYDSAGALAWATRAGGSSRDRGQGVSLDGAGTSYVTGFFYVEAIFGPGEPNQTQLSGGSNDIFVARFAKGGNEPPDAKDDIAAATVGTPETIYVLANDTDPDGDVLVVSAVMQGVLGVVVNYGGSVTYTADVFGSLRTQIGALPLNNGQKNSLLAKLNAADASFARGNRTAGLNQLGALINELEALKRTGRLDPAVADSLSAQVLAIQSGSLTDTFTYTVSDGHGGTDAATVTVSLSF